jgi:hypothetical protein
LLVSVVELPPGLAATSQPYIPDVGRLYWLESELLDPHDPEERRPGVVVSAPETLFGTVNVAMRSTTDGYGVAHDQCHDLGLGKAGHFSRLRPVQCQLWTPDAARSSELLDAETFAWVLRRFDQ